MSHKRLNKFDLMIIEIDLLDKFDVEDVVNEFVTKYRRRIAHFN